MLNCVPRIALKLMLPHSAQMCKIKDCRWGITVFKQLPPQPQCSRDPAQELMYSMYKTVCKMCLRLKIKNAKKVDVLWMWLNAHSIQFTKFCAITGSQFCMLFFHVYCSEQYRQCWQVNRSPTELGYLLNWLIFPFSYYSKDSTQRR